MALRDRAIQQPCVCTANEFLDRLDAPLLRAMTVMEADRKIAPGLNLTGSDHQPIAEIEFAQCEQMAIAARPCTIVEIATESGKTACCVDIGECRNRATNPWIEIGFRPAPIGVQKSVSAIMRNRNGDDLRLSERLTVTFDGGADSPALFYDFGKVIPRQPH